jgi:hypothetical protein
MNTQEKEPELGEGVTSAEFWVYDGKLGRRWNVDPKLNFSNSGYLAFSNNPIFLSDQKGDTAIVTGSKRNIREFLRHLKQVTGNKYSIDKNNHLQISSQGNRPTNKRRSATLSFILNKTITSERIIKLALTRNDDVVLFDHYDNGLWDVKDFRQSTRIMKAAMIAHVFAERLSSLEDISSPVSGRHFRNLDYSQIILSDQSTIDRNYVAGHEIAKKYESIVACEMLNIPYSLVRLEDDKDPTTELTESWSSDYTFVDHVYYKWSIYGNIGFCMTVKGHYYIDAATGQPAVQSAGRIQGRFKKGVILP